MANTAKPVTGVLHTPFTSNPRELERVPKLRLANRVGAP